MNHSAFLTIRFLKLWSKIKCKSNEVHGEYMMLLGGRVTTLLQCDGELYFSLKKKMIWLSFKGEQGLYSTVKFKQLMPPYSKAPFR